MNAWETNFIKSIKKQKDNGKTLSEKQVNCLNKIMAKYNVGQAGLDSLEVNEEELTFKQRFGQCEDAPCCGCCGRNVYGGY